MDTTLVFDHVWKRFRRGAVHDSLREVIPAMMRRLSGKRKPEMGERDFWALQDLSFEVKPGEVLGIIGGNGAGKSTTLKILNELMEPTRGRVEIRGKIGSLIEVSAGFHQDLTGRQNVFLQGAIMGMKRAEVLLKFDQIVEFAGVADFIDTPVKRYSSGMNARLGFSIAAHLEPDVLIIDEVLAVGDHAFQQRAFAKIKAMATGGIPVVLVSHQLDRITELCTKAILLEKGKVKATGTPTECVNAYLHPDDTQRESDESAESGLRFGPMRAMDDRPIRSGDRLSVVAEIATSQNTFPAEWRLGFCVVDTKSGVNMHTVLNDYRGISMPEIGVAEHRIDIQLNLPASHYYVQLMVWDCAKANVVIAGSRINVEVLDHSRYWGAAQLNSLWSARMVSSDRLAIEGAQRGDNNGERDRITADERG